LSVPERWRENASEQFSFISREEIMLVQPRALSADGGGGLLSGYLNLSHPKPRYKRHDDAVRAQGRRASHADQREQFQALVWPHAEAVLRAAHYLLSDPDEADDLGQETMVKAYRSLSRFRDGNMRAWLMTILRNARIDQLRAAVLPTEEADLEVIESGPRSNSDREDTHERIWTDPDELLDGVGDRQVIAALRGLPNEIRWTLLLVDVEQMDPVDAAAALNVPVGTIKSRAYRGRAMLRSALLPAAKHLRLVP
jgi:RNA polymerase sigma-70 factor (ECF subfamily)